MIKAGQYTVILKATSSKRYAILPDTDIRIPEILGYVCLCLYSNSFVKTFQCFGVH